ncbi:unnamed protein product [Lasius platythorax]|uniref:Uncharacterized protein n=1 Tax=Lasius platythorax TaxID=488582 RepID=A0AAV2NL66_9HYME
MRESDVMFSPCETSHGQKVVQGITWVVRYQLRSFPNAARFPALSYDDVLALFSRGHGAGESEREGEWFAIGTREMANRAVVT